jgi:hypothetical protein
MSRAYRISVKESVNRVIRAEDQVSTELEIIEVLPCEDMARLLADELEKRGFKREGEVMVRTEEGVTVSVDPKTGTVTVRAEMQESVTEETEKTGHGYDDVGPSQDKIRENLKSEAQKDLERKVQERNASLQNKVTDQLEQQLGDIRAELDQAVNRVTAEALKQKARSMGQIKEMTEDPQTGNLTIVVEV